METAFDLSAGTVPSGGVHHEAMGIAYYIPIGCLRILQSDSGLATEIWDKYSRQWTIIAHPRDAFILGTSRPLDLSQRECLMKSSVMKPFRALHQAQWIRLEFKTNNQTLGQFRIYILPEDVGQTVINRRDRNLRKSMTTLLARTDVSRKTWIGKWHLDTPITSVDPIMDHSEKQDESLFHVFNSLPSPKPETDVVKDYYTRSAMENLLASDIPGLQTSLYHYQRRSAALMLQREAQPLEIIDPRLTLLRDQNLHEYYYDCSTSYAYRSPRRYEAATGGILAETMGLGKTLICLSLILATLEFPSQIPVEHSIDQLPVRLKPGSLRQMTAAAICRSGRPWRADLTYFEQRHGIELDKCREVLTTEGGFYMMHAPPSRRQSRKPIIPPPRKIWLSHATLVVVPPNLLQQWRQEIKKHTHGLKVLYMRDFKTDVPPAEELRSYDIILFSKQRFEKESRQSATNGEHYRSPLQNIHFKRLIVDEGHTFGNSSNSARTEALAVVDSLQLTSRWIVSGTPTQGLYGAETVSISTPESQAQPLPSSSMPSSSFVSKESDKGSRPAVKRLLPTSEQEMLFYKHERKDLEKLGNIATHFLKARPWASIPAYEAADADLASWNQLVMQPRHGSKSRGNMDCLRATLEGLIIRHKPEDVLQDVALPPLYQSVVKLEGSVQNKLSLNTFALMIITNAVTSERKDADYFFHHRQHKNLLQLVTNLRCASFFWSGFEADDVDSTVGNASRFLEVGEVKVSLEDEHLLRQAMQMGETVLSNPISKLISSTHEMPFYIDNSWAEDVRKAWSLNGEVDNPTLIGATYLHNAQQKIESQLKKGDPLTGLATAAQSVTLHNHQQVNDGSWGDGRRRVKDRNTVPALAGGVTIGEASSSRPRVKSTTASTNRLLASEVSQDPSPLDSLQSGSPSKPRRSSTHGAESASMSGPSGSAAPSTASASDAPASSQQTPDSKKKHKKSNKQADPTPLDRAPLESTHIISTASTKLSYLLDSIIQHQADEKILVFYESENVAFYITQALDCLGIKYLIYAKSLSSTRRSQYVVSFNQSTIFRVLLMDVSQAAFGLDISSASRVFFVNPVFSPQVEAQAVKRAHRIGQTRPVYVETLVLEGSIEEAIVERRKAMTSEEHQRCKSILDDQTMYDWVRNVKFIPVDASVSGTEQMARLRVRQEVVGGDGVEMDPDEDLILEDESPDGKRRDKGKGKARVVDKEKRRLENDEDGEASTSKKVRFA